MRTISLSRFMLPMLVLAACNKAAPPADQAVVSGPRTVHITATDFAFGAPDTLTAGYTAFHLMNNGKEMHHLSLVRLAEGQTAADIAKLDPNSPEIARLVMVGGPNAAGPDGTSEAVVELKPGRYAMFCFIPSADMKPHFMKGMMRDLVVIAGETAPVAPTADATIKMTDFAFEVSGTLNAGRHLVKVENAGPQPHEWVVVKLNPGVTVQQFVQWAEKMQGPPPGSPAGGASPITVGEVNYVSVDLTPGEYGFICFATDPASGKPHFMLGMMKQITVQ